MDAAAAAEMSLSGRGDEGPPTVAALRGAGRGGPIHHGAAVAAMDVRELARGQLADGRPNKFQPLLELELHTGSLHGVKPY